MGSSTVRSKIVVRGGELREALRAMGDWAEALHLMSAWASAGAGNDPHWKLLPLDRIHRALIGTHFAQTEPWILRALNAEAGRLRVATTPSGVFHPKLILATCGRDAKALLGSSNFTRGGFRTNVELNVLLEGAAASQPFSELFSFFEEQWTAPFTTEVSEEWIDRYEIAFQDRPAPRRIPSPRTTHDRVQSASDLSIGWADYYSLLRDREVESGSEGWEIGVFTPDWRDSSYLREVEDCRAAFSRASGFAEMTLADRKLVGGIRPFASGYLGGGDAAGRFKALVNGQPELLAEWLDRVPLEGPVTRALAESVLEGLTGLHGVGLGVASRLLAVKRPDRFVTLNNANKERVRTLWGRPTGTASGYLDWHEDLWALAWCLAPPPDDRYERRAWEARVALLDALIYQPPE